MTNSCYQCKDRVAGCHTNCERYARFAAERKKVRDAVKKEAEYRGYVRDKDARWIKRNGLN